MPEKSPPHDHKPTPRLADPLTYPAPTPRQGTSRIGHAPWSDRVFRLREEMHMANALSDNELRLIDAYWRAANYLAVGQIYLYDNPLLEKPLTKEHIKPRLLGHWGTTPGLNFLYVHLNRIIRKYELNMMYITGPGHGGPGLVANAYLEGTYSEVYPNIPADAE